MKFRDGLQISFFSALYAPGMFYILENGYGYYVRDSTDLNTINKCILLDNQVLNQQVTQVSFADIKEADGYSYFGIALSRLCPSKIKHPLLSDYLKNVDSSVMPFQWHFIMRTPLGIWLHKPNWIQPAEEIEWEKYGTHFSYDSYNELFNMMVPVEAFCYNNFFYRIEQ